MHFAASFVDRTIIEDGRLTPDITLTGKTRIELECKMAKIILVFSKVTKFPFKKISSSNKIH